jgi:hypothetical protein
LTSRCFNSPRNCTKDRPFAKIPMDTYTEAHLMVAAVRILQHRNGSPPKIEDVCALLEISDEAGHSISRKLAKLGIIERLEDPFSIKLAVANHLEIEKISRNVPEAKGLSRELEEFQAKKMKAEKKLSDIQAEIERKKRDLLSSVEAKFKKEMEKYKKD